ncbi:MAG TPA: DUF4126 domain-containing protein [Anaerolineales bacterium]|nr:DUF4126 domain-containing protein [Anaerolineales bacterium]
MDGIFSAFGLSASAGLNAYIPLLIVSLVGKFTDLITLKEPWDALTSWWIIGLLIVLSVIEFFADKVPAVNHVNDIIQTIIRPAAGAIVFAASADVITDIHPVLSVAAGLLIAGGVHAAKALAVRPAVSATTAGAGNTFVSIIEDIISTLLSIMAVLIPVLGILLIMFGIWAIWWSRQRRKRRRAAEARAHSQ